MVSMKKIIWFVGGIIIFAVLGRLGWAFYQVKSDQNINSFSIPANTATTPLSVPQATIAISTTESTTTTTMQPGTIVVSNNEMGTSVQISDYNGAGQRTLTVQNAGSTLVDAKAGQVMTFEGSKVFPLGYSGIVQSVKTTIIKGVSTTAIVFVPAKIGDVFQNLNISISDVPTAKLTTSPISTPTPQSLKNCSPTKDGYSHPGEMTITFSSSYTQSYKKLVNATELDCTTDVQTQRYFVNEKEVTLSEYTTAKKSN